LPAAAIAQVARRVVRSDVTAAHELEIAGCLIAVGRGLIAVGRGLIAVGCGLIAVSGRLLDIRDCLLAVGESLIVVARPRNSRRCVSLPLAPPVPGTDFAVTWRWAAHGGPPHGSRVSQ
jgi:hypothetical protein